MGIPAGAFRYRCTILRRARIADDVLSGRGDYAAVSNLTRIAAAFRSETLRAEVLGNQPVPGVDAELTLRLSDAAQTITVADLVDVEGQRFQIASIEPPDRLHGVIRFKLKRATR